MTVPYTEAIDTILKYDEENQSISPTLRVSEIGFDGDIDKLDKLLQGIKYVPKKQLADFVNLHAPIDSTAIFLFSSFIDWSDNQKEASDISKDVMTFGNAVVYKTNDGEITITSLMPIVINDGTKKEIYYLDNANTFHTEQGSFRFENGKRVDATGLIYENIYLFSIDENKPITYPVYNLLFQYDASLTANEKSLRRFAEAILVLSGNTPKQNLNDEDYRKMVNALVINLLPKPAPGGEAGATPTANFISAPLNTEAREAWSNRIRFELMQGMMMIDFSTIGGNPSSYTMSIYAYPTLKRAENIGDQLLEKMKELFDNSEMSFKVELPSDATQTMAALNNVEFLSTKTKIEQSFPDWDEDKVADELRRVDVEGNPTAVATAIDNVLGGGSIG